jgi:hypothetical protein
MPDLSTPGARVTAIPPSFAARVGQAVRYAITGITPATWFGPMQPLQPMAPIGTGGRAILIERTDALREETVELKTATNDLKSIYVEMRLALQSLTVRLAQLEGGPSLASLAARLDDCESGVKDWRRVKERAVGWSIRIAGAVLLFGATGGALFRAVFDR